MWICGQTIANKDFYMRRGRHIRTPTFGVSEFNSFDASKSDTVETFDSNAQQRMHAA